MADAFVDVTIFIYFHFVLFIKTQYVILWYDDMSTASAWNITNPDNVGIVNGDYWSSYWDYSDYYYENPCPSDGYEQSEFCVSLDIQNSVGASIYRLTDISYYKWIRLQFDIGGLEISSTDDECQVLYAYDSVDNKTLLYSQSGRNINNVIIDLPPSPHSTLLWIFLESWDGGQPSANLQSCYWDDVYLKGTVNPTVNPSVVGLTVNPSAQPSEAPSNEPTKETRIPTSKEKFIFDSLAAVLIAICGSLCVIIVITLVIGSIWERKRKKRLKNERHIVEVSAVKIAEIKKENRTRMEDSSDSEQLYVKHDDHITNTKGTKQAEAEEGESSDKDAEELYDHEGMKRIEEDTCTKQTSLAPKTAQNVQQGTNDIELAEIQPQSAQTTMSAMRNVDESNVDDEGHRDTTKIDDIR
eukprot:859954_1